MDVQQKESLWKLLNSIICTKNIEIVSSSIESTTEFNADNKYRQRLVFEFVKEDKTHGTITLERTSNSNNLVKLCL